MKCETAEQPVLWYEIRGSLYLNISDRCTLVCQFCPKTHGDPQVHQYNLVLQKQPKAQAVIATLPALSQYQEVVFCGFGEPTLRLKPLLEIARYCKEQGAQTRLNTDGLGCLVHKRNIIPELSEVIDTVSVSLNAQNEAVYRSHCHPQLPNAYSAVKEFIKHSVGAFKAVRVTAIDGLAGVDVIECQKIAENLGAKFVCRYLDKVG